MHNVLLWLVAPVVLVVVVPFLGYVAGRAAYVIDEKTSAWAQRTADRIRSRRAR